MPQDNFDIQQKKTKLKIDNTTTKFPESNLMHGINGYVYCNGPTLQLTAGQRVRWMVMGFGSEPDMHSPVFDGQAVEYAGVYWLSDRLWPRVQRHRSGNGAINASCVHFSHASG